VQRNSKNDFHAKPAYLSAIRTPLDLHSSPVEVFSAATILALTTHNLTSVTSLAWVSSSEHLNDVWSYLRLAWSKWPKQSALSVCSFAS
jgi:hypothetical protein